MKSWKETFPTDDGLAYVLPNSEVDIAPLSDDVWAHKEELRAGFCEAWTHAFDPPLVELTGDEPSLIMPGKTVREMLKEIFGHKP